MTPIAEKVDLHRKQLSFSKTHARPLDDQSHGGQLVPPPPGAQRRSRHLGVIEGLCHHAKHA